MPLAPGTRVGAYEISSRIGAGGMGEVYRAHDSRLGRDVALKVVPPEMRGEPGRDARFEREARAAAALNHPNIVAVYDVGRAEPGFYIVSELVEGESLRARIGRGPLPPRAAIEIGSQVADALAAAHAAGIVHRDIKPENVMLSARDGRAKVLDFGLARQDRARAAQATETEALTSPGMVVGTARYMSPEQVRGERVDGRSDIFSLGATLYEALTGRQAFAGATSVDVLHAVLHSDPPEAPEAGGALERVLRRCLEKRPERRFQSAADLAFALTALTERPSAGVAAARGGGGARRARRAGAAAVAGLAAAGCFWAGREWRAEKTAPVFAAVRTPAGAIAQARFSGEAALFALSPEEGPARTMLAEASGATREMGAIAGYTIAAVSDRGGMALLRTEPGRRGPTLYISPPEGGSPRPAMNDVLAADWAPGGTEVAVVRAVGPSRRLEFPMGTALWEEPSLAPAVRVSGDGRQVACARYENGAAWLYTVDRGGAKKRLAQLSGRIYLARTLCWSAKGDEIWFSSYRPTDDGVVHGVDRNGRQRVVARFPGATSLEDVSAGGRALLKREQEFAFMRAVRGGTESDFSWGGAAAVAMSADGSRALLTDGAGEQARILLRSLDGSPPIYFGRGNVGPGRL